jgi:hypothetical protein
MRLINAVASGETPTDQELTDGRAVLNDVLDSLNAERLMIYTIQPQTLTLVAGTQAYTVGEGGDLNVPRPPKIEKIILRDNTSGTALDSPLKLYTLEEYGKISQKTFGNSYPCGVYDDAGYPTRSLKFLPIPGANLQAIIFGWYPLAQVTANDDTIALPPAYAKALRWQLAADLFPEYNLGESSPSLEAKAAKEWAKIRAMNSTPILIKPDQGVFGGSGCGGSSLADFYRGNF